MSYILQTNQLTKTIGGKDLVSNADIHVKKGEIYGFLGPNGAGKTTVMKMITELLVLDEPTNGLDPAGMKQIRDLFRMLSTKYAISIMISSHLLAEIECIADTIGVINYGKIMKEVSMKKITEMNTAFIELVVEDTRKASYVLAEKLSLNNFKIVDDSKIRIYEMKASTQEISRAMLVNGVEIASINKKAETLEDYFLKMTSEAK